jgi:hypothetical protein
MSLILGILAQGDSAPISVPGYNSIATVTVGSGGQTSIDFNSIPATYKHLQVRYLCKSDRASYSIDGFLVQFNNITTASYSAHRVFGTGSAPSADGGSSLTSINVSMGVVGSGPSTTFGVGVIDVLDYGNTSKYKTMRYLGGSDLNGTFGTGSYGGYVGLASGLFQSTNAISSIKIMPESGTNFTQYSSFALYGIEG